MAMMIVCAVSLLGGCAGGSTEETKKAETAETSEAAQEEITLRMISWQTDHQSGDQKIIDAYEAEHPGIKIKMEYQGDQNANEYNKKVDLMVMGGENIDIIMAANTSMFAQRVSTGMYLPMDEYASNEGIKLDEVYSGTIMVDGKQYAIPGDLKAGFVLINRDMLDAAGLEVPPLDWTWEDYREYAKKMTHGEGAEKIYGSYVHNWYIHMGGAKKDSPFFVDETTPAYDSDAYRDFFQLLYEMENVDGCSTPYSEIASLNMSYRDRFFNGYAAMIPIGSYMISEVGQQDKYPHDFVTTFAPLPSMAGSDLPSGSTDIQNLFYCIAKTASHPQEAYDFLRYYTTKGLEIKGLSIPMLKNYDRMKAIESIITAPEYYDMEALGNVFRNPDWYDNVVTIVPSYAAEVEALGKEEAIKFRLGEQDLESTIQNMQSGAEKIIKEAKE